MNNPEIVEILYTLIALKIKTFIKVIFIISYHVIYVRLNFANIILLILNTPLR
jgi:hypothetical protein